ncbi:MAG: isoprenylcysteine carboxylmethyltransferase family protein [Gaiellales bacterium]
MAADDEQRSERSGPGRHERFQRDPGGFRPRILPPFWAGIIAGAMLAIDGLCRSLNLAQLEAGTLDQLTTTSYVLFAAGVVLSAWAALGFSRVHTPIEPGYVPLALLTSGPYRISRNPIYLGMLLTLLAWAAWLGQPLTLLGPLMFIVVIQRRIIRHEERMLSEQFGEQYAAYRGRVRRWL